MYPPGYHELGSLRVDREIRRREIVGDARAIAGPVGIDRADGCHVDQVNFVDEVGELVDLGLDRHEAVHRQNRLTVDRNRVRDAAHRHILDVRGFRAEDGDDLVGLPLDIEGLKVVRDGDEIYFRREFHRRMAPIAVRERPELSGADEGLQLLLGLLHDLLSVQRPVAVLLDPGGGLDGIGFERRDDVDKIERREVIEVHDVIMDRVRGHDHIADDIARSAALRV